MGKEHELLHAVKEGNGQYVRKTLYKYRKSKKHNNKKPFINVPDHEGFAPLHYAALSGDVDMVMAIIEMEGDPNGRDTKGMTPIHLASWGGKDTTVKALLDNGGLPNLSSMSGDTALHLSAQHGYAACIKVLLDYRTDASLCNSNMETPLDLACQFGHTSAVRELLTDEKVTFMLITPPTNGKSPLHLSAKCGHDDIVHLLLQAGANVNEETSDGTPLHLAALYGKTNVVRLLLDAGADVNISNSNGLMPLDLVNKFTASRAGLQIKELLRKASGERVEYAVAVSDYNNQYDESCLSFKSGDSIAVIEQNENGRWKGYVVNSEHEHFGYFPAMAVQLINQNENTLSVCSVGSVVSNESSAARNTETSKHEKRTLSGTSLPQAVGIVPIGNFEVVTLSQNDAEIHAPPPQTASGSIPPRMSSFKQKKSAQKRFQSPPSQPASPPQTTSPLQNAAALRENHSIHPVMKELFPSSSPPKAPIRSVSIKQSSDNENQRTGTSSVQHEISQALKKGIKLNSHDSVKTSKYAELQYETGLSSKQNIEVNPTNYSTVYFSEANHSQQTIEDFNLNTVNHKHSDGQSVNPTLANNKYFNGHRVNPTLAKSKSHDESIIMNTRGHGSDTQVHFSKVMDQRRGNTQQYENVSQDSPPPQLPIKRSLTLPSSVQYNRQSNESFTSDDFSNGKQSNRTVYENTRVLNQGSLSPGSPRSPNFLFQNGIHDTNGNFHLKSSPRLSKRDPEMLNWLTEMKLTCYYDNFITHGFDMVSVHAITPEDLNILGITKTGHRKKLLGEIAKLPFTEELSNHKPRDVGSWLGQLNLRQYEPNFVEGGFDDIDFIKDLDMNDLEMIDIKKKGHQKKLLLAVQRLNELELTAVLDIAVAESPIKRASSFNNKTREIQEFFPSIPTPMSSSTEQENADVSKQNPPPVSSKPKKQPVPVPPKPPKSAPPPAAKPKPKPVSNVLQHESGLIQGSQEEVVKSSKSRDFFKLQEQKLKDEDSPTNTIERKSSYSERKSSFSERKNETMSPTNTSHKKSPVPPPATKPRSMSNSSDKGQDKAAPPVATKRLPPPAPPKRSGSLSENSTVTPATPDSPLTEELIPEEHLNATEPSPRMPSFKPPPPPAAETITTQPQQTSHLNEHLPSPPSATNDEVSPPSPAFTLPEPPSEETLPQPPGEVPLPPPPTVNVESPTLTVLPIHLPGDVDNSEVDHGFAETDDIMADIMADIDDFSKQIDSMF